MVKNITDYGKRIKLLLVVNGQNQNWLIEQVRSKTGLYFDSSYLHKIMIGTEKNEKVTAAINEILGIN
jgi:hypothetical protein